MSGNHDSTGLIRKRSQVISLLRNHRGIVVALSGGVDSAVLLALAVEALGPDKVVAATGRSAAVTDREIDDAATVAAAVGVRHVVIQTDELDRSGYRRNAGDRCFHCRSALFSLLSEMASREGLDAIAYGAIVDDLADDRPGMLAATKLGIVAPLLEAGICKEDVRELARQLNLHVSNKQANACLASRIPMGNEVTPEKLRQVGEAESALLSLGFRVFRVRHHGDLARIELGAGEEIRLEDAALRTRVVAAVKAAGFGFVALDLEPYGQGRLHSIEPIRLGGQ